MTNQITVSRELLRQVLDALREIAWSNDSKWQSDRAQGMTEPLRNALEQPAVEPVAWAYLFDDDGSLCQTFDTLKDAEEWVASDDNMWSGYIAPLFTAHQAQHPDDELAKIEKDIAETCMNTPPGWRCTRKSGHDGPCADVPAPEDIDFVQKGMVRLRESTAPQAQQANQ